MDVSVVTARALPPPPQAHNSAQQCAKTCRRSDHIGYGTPAIPTQRLGLTHTQYGGRGRTRLTCSACMHTAPYIHCLDMEPLKSCHGELPGAAAMGASPRSVCNLFRRKRTHPECRTLDQFHDGNELFDNSLHRRARQSSPRSTMRRPLRADGVNQMGPGHVASVNVNIVLLEHPHQLLRCLEVRLALHHSPHLAQSSKTPLTPRWRSFYFETNLLLRGFVAIFQWYLLRPQAHSYLDNQHFPLRVWDSLH